MFNIKGFHGTRGNEISSISSKAVSAAANGGQARIRLIQNLNVESESMSEDSGIRSR